MESGTELLGTLIEEFQFGPVKVRVRKIAEVMWAEPDGFSRSRELPSVGAALDYAHQVKARLEIDAYIESLQRHESQTHDRSDK